MGTARAVQFQQGLEGSGTWDVPPHPAAYLQLLLCSGCLLADGVPHFRACRAAERDRAQPHTWSPLPGLSQVPLPPPAVPRERAGQRGLRVCDKEWNGAGPKPQLGQQTRGDLGWPKQLLLVKAGWHRAWGTTAPPSFGLEGAGVGLCPGVGEMKSSQPRGRAGLMESSEGDPWHCCTKRPFQVPSPKPPTALPVRYISSPSVNIWWQRTHLAQVGW